jgi:hypothetical protein
MWSLNRRYHGLNYEAISYDVFGFPHESLHTAGEILEWFDRAGVAYLGSFAPLRLRDYLFAFSLLEYWQFRETFDGSPVMRLTADGLAGVARLLEGRGSPCFSRPSRLETILCQTVWVPCSTRFNCFTIAGRKR